MTASALPMRLLAIDRMTLSNRYLLGGILLALFSMFWLVGASSGLFGQPPDAWIGTASDILVMLMGVYTLLGLLNLTEVRRRQQSEQNEPITPLVLNTFGLLLALIFVLRVAYVTQTDPQPFVTWAGLSVNGVIRGGVYALIALGYTLVYGILFMINFAHGEVMMFGAYAGYLAMALLVDSGNRTFESGAAMAATFIVPVIVGIILLPFSDLRRDQEEGETGRIPLGTWGALPVRFIIGVIIGYGALVGLGGYAPQVYLLVITVVGILFVMAVGMFVSTLVSIILERVAYRPLRNAPRLAPLISAIGASFFLQQVALRIFGPNRKGYAEPLLLNEPRNFIVDLGDLGTLPVSKVGLMVVFLSIFFMLMLFFIVQRTKFGRAMRAVSEDKQTAALMGINVNRTIMLTFMLGASLAGAAGVMLGLRGENIDFRFGFTPGIKAFTAAVLGGIGNIPGAMFGGFFLGIVEALGPLLLGFEFKWQNVIAFSMLALVIIFRPTGIFGESASEKKV